MRNTAKRSTIALALSGALLSPAAVGGAALTGLTAFAVASSSKAAEVPVTNLTATMSVAEGATLDPNFGFNLTLGWSVPNGAAEGDTSTITLPNYLSGGVLTQEPVKDTAGNTIAYISGAGQNYVVTYTDYVTTHTATNVSTKLPLQGVASAWGGPNTVKPVTATVDTQTVTAGNVRLNYLEQITWASSSRIVAQTATPQTDMFTKTNDPMITATTAGTTITSKFVLDDATLAYAKWNCAEVSNGYQLQYTIFDSASNTFEGYPTSTGDGTDPWHVKVTGCTDSTLTITYDAPADAAGKGIQVRTYDMSNNNLGLISLTPKAIAEQYEGPYTGRDYFTSATGESLGFLASHGFYTFTESQGSGTAFPTANPDVAETPFQTPVTVDVTANDTTAAAGVTVDKSTVRLVDADGKLVTELTTEAGTYVVNPDGTITFTPAGEVVGPQPAVTYSVADSNGGTATSTLTVTVGEAPVTTTVGCDDVIVGTNGTSHIANGDGTGHYTRGGTKGHGYGYGHCHPRGKGHMDSSSLTTN